MVITRTWYLEVNNVPLATPAWECPDLSAILDDPNLVGSDVHLPRVHGDRPYRRWITTTVLTFPLDVFGDVDSDGDPIEDPFEGLNTNLDYLKANLGFAAGGDGTVVAELHRGDLDSLVADVHFLGFKGTRTSGDRLLRTTFDLSIPAGRFEAAGS